MEKLVIVGGGVAGLTAAVYAARAELQPVVLEASVWGGQIITAPKIDNYPAIPEVSGWDLAQRLKTQAQALGVETVSAEVRHIERLDGFLALHTNNELYNARALILAPGATRRKLGCDGEERLSGKRLSYCAVCDGPFFKGRDVAIIGGGNAAFEEAWYLAQLCRSVFLVHRREQFRAQPALVNRLRQRQNVKMLTPYVTTAVLGDDRVQGIELRSLETGAVLGLRVDGVFASIGLEPQNAFCSGLVAIDEEGYLYAGEDCLTDVPGVFAAGDCRRKPLRQLVTAMSDGAVAATAAAEFLGV